MAVSLTTKVDITCLAQLDDAEDNPVFDAQDVAIQAPGWVTGLEEDIRLSSPIVWKRGNMGVGVLDRVADIGTATFVLDNSESNSAGQAGYYSPARSAVARFQFGLDTKIRIRQVEDDGTEHYEWQGIINRIEPTSGTLGDRATLVSAEDWMAIAQRSKVKGITVQENKRDDELITTLLGLATKTPSATSLSTGSDTYEIALHDENSLTSSIMRIFNKLTASGFGKIYLEGYETLYYKSRGDLILSGTPVATLSDSMTDVKLAYSRDYRVYETNVITYPAQRDTLDAILWQAQEEVEVLAGETKTFEVQLRDPDGRAVRIAATSLATPVAGTDFKFSSVAESESGDKNGDITIAYTLTSDLVTVSLTNTSLSNGYLAPHQIKGKGVYLYEPVATAKFTGQPDGERLNVDMVYQSDVDVGQDISNLVTSWFTVDSPRVESVTFIANTNPTLLDASFASVGDLVTIEESQTGLSENYIINGKTKSSGYNGRITKVTWALVPANQISGVCILDLPGSAELDSTAYLGA